LTIYNKKDSIIEKMINERKQTLTLKYNYPMEEYSKARILQDTKNIINRFHGKKLL